MAPKTGRMGVVLPQGPLFRGGVEAQIRKHLLENDLVEAVIGLAPNLFYGTGLAACVIVLRQRKDKRKKGKVLIVDASSVFRRGRAQNFMDPALRSLRGCRASPTSRTAPASSTAPSLRRRAGHSTSSAMCCRPSVPTSRRCPKPWPPSKTPSQSVAKRKTTCAA